MAKLQYKNILTEKEREEIYKDVWQENIKDVGIKYGVSGNTVRKWCELTNIPYPRRGELKAYLAGEIQRPRLQPITLEVRTYVVPFRMKFQVKAMEGQEQLTSETIEEIGIYTNRLCNTKIYHPQTDLFSEKREDIHPIVVKQLVLKLKVFEEVYNNLCTRLKQINPQYEIDENIVDMNVLKYFSQIGQPFTQRLEEILSEMSTDRKNVQAMGLGTCETKKKVEDIYVDKITQAVDTLYNEDMRIISDFKQIAYHRMLTKMLGMDYNQDHEIWYNYTQQEQNKVLDIMGVEDLLPILDQGGNLDRSARITNVILKVLEVYAPGGVTLLHPYNIYDYAEKIIRYYEDDYKTYVKVGEMILGLKLQRDLEGMCLSIKFIEGRRLNKKTKSVITTTTLTARDTATKSIENQLKDMLVGLLEMINDFKGNRSKYYKSSGIYVV